MLFLQNDTYELRGTQIISLEIIETVQLVHDIHEIPKKKIILGGSIVIWIYLYKYAYLLISYFVLWCYTWCGCPSWKRILDWTPFISLSLLFICFPFFFSFPSLALCLLLSVCCFPSYSMYCCSCFRSLSPSAFLYLFASFP